MFSVTLIPVNWDMFREVMAHNYQAHIHIEYVYFMRTNKQRQYKVKNFSKAKPIACQVQINVKYRNNDTANS